MQTTLANPLPVSIPSPLSVRSEVLQAPCKIKLELRPDGVRYLVFSDVHLGNQRNPAWRIINNLRAYFDDFSDTSQFAKLDLIVIAGDLFDKALWLGNEDLGAIVTFLLNLFDFCERNKIALRYLEGTFSHDRKQFRNLLPMASKFPALDFKYIDEMCVEAFYDLGITCLYVPDEHAGGGAASQALIAKELERLEIEKVSISMVHSWFNYHLPDIPSKTKYDEKFFLDRTIYYVSNAHIHTPSTFDRLINQGSFDRIAHNEEHAKGGVLFELRPESQYFFFIENKLALPFKTLHIKTNDMVKALGMIDKVAKDLPEYSWLRIKAKETNPILTSLVEHLSKTYHHVRFEKITEEEEDKKNRRQLVDQQSFDNIDYVSPELNKGNIVDSIIQEMKERELDNHDPKLLKQILEGVV